MTTFTKKCISYLLHNICTACRWQSYNFFLVEIDARISNLAWNVYNLRSISDTYLETMRRVLGALFPEWTGPGPKFNL